MSSASKSKIKPFSSSGFILFLIGSLFFQLFFSSHSFSQNNSTVINQKSESPKSPNITTTGPNSPVTVNYNSNEEVLKELRSLRKLLEKKSGPPTEKKRAVVPLSHHEREEVVRLNKGVEVAYQDWLKNQKKIGSDSVFEMLLEDGRILRYASKYYKSFERFNQAFDVKPRNWEILKELGWSLRDIGKYAAAERKLQDALELVKTKKEKASVLGNLAGVLQAQGKYPEAEKLYRQSLDIFMKRLSANHPYIKIAKNNLEFCIKSATKSK